MINMNLRMVELVHEELVRYKREQKPHMSLNSLIIEAIQEYLKKKREGYLVTPQEVEG